MLISLTKPVASRVKTILRPPVDEDFLLDIFLSHSLGIKTEYYTIFLVYKVFSIIVKIAKREMKLWIKDSSCNWWRNIFGLASSFYPNFLKGFILAEPYWVLFWKKPKTQKAPPNWTVIQKKGNDRLFMSKPIIFSGLPFHLFLFLFAFFQNFFLPRRDHIKLAFLGSCGALHTLCISNK